MTDESDALRILQDRERRKTLERLRIEGERRDRQAGLDRLQVFEFQGSAELPDSRTRGEPLPRVRVVPSQFDSAQVPVLPSGARSAIPGPPSSREIGGAVRPPAVSEFLAIDPGEGFDIQRLNSLRFPPLLREAASDPNLLATIAGHADRLIVRVKQEVDDPLSAGALLRDQVLRWYRESPTDADWSVRMPVSWAGLFAESRAAGGRLEVWLNQRLWSLRDHAARAGSLGHRLKRGLSRDRKAVSAIGRTPSQQIHAEVAQALLDDLATHPRDGELPVPLVRLSELAVRRQVTTINDALALLFSAPESGPFVLLHPNRYPDCAEVVLRPPTAGASGAALAFSLVPGRAARKGPAKGRAAGGAESDPSARDGDPVSSDEEEVDAASVWEAETVEPATWRRILGERRRERKRLDSPPKECRTRPAYKVLRDLLLDDSAVRLSFLSVRWRGRPSGVPLLATLLQKGTLAPEVATDHEYLEAELGDLVQGDPEWQPPDGRWQARGWTIVREGSRSEGLRYTATHEG